MPDSKFLETYPLYRKFKMKIPEQRHYSIPKPPIHMDCKNCRDIRTFKMVGEYYEEISFVTAHLEKEKVKSGDFERVQKLEKKIENALDSRGAIVKVEYNCAACEKFKRTFILKFSENLDYVVKVGQHPPWDISISKNLEEILDKYSDTYKKGLVCESQGYGIGAYAYYRRIVEEIIDELLNSIEELIEKEDEKDKYKRGLEEVRKTTVAQSKIELVKDLLPSILTTSDMNPLAILHSKLSEGLHARTDEECLEIAEAIREALEFLINRVIENKKSAYKFTESMKKLLDKNK